MTINQLLRMPAPYIFSFSAGYFMRVMHKWKKDLEFIIFIKPVFFIAQLLVLFMIVASDFLRKNPKNKPLLKQVIPGNGKLAIIIPNYKGEHLLQKLLLSLKRQTYKNIEVVVVDNDSNDNSETIVRNFPDVRWVDMKGKRGFAAAVNMGVRSLNNVEFIALLNNDTEVEPEWAELQINMLRLNLNAGMAGARIYQKGFDRLINIHAHAIGSDMRCYNMGAGQRDNGQFDKFIPVLGVSGCSMMIRAQAFYEVGGFDENFFLCYEDIDFSLRMFWSNWDCYVVPKAVCYHVSNANLETGSQTHIRNILLNDLLWVVKNIPSEIVLKNKTDFLFATFNSEEIRLFFLWQGWRIVLWRLLGLGNIARGLRQRRVINKARLRTADAVLPFIIPVQEVNLGRLYRVETAERYLVSRNKIRKNKMQQVLFPDKIEEVLNFTSPVDSNRSMVTFTDDPQIHFKIDGFSRFNLINIDMTCDYVSWGQLIFLCRNKNGNEYFLASNHFRVSPGSNHYSFTVDKDFFIEKQGVGPDLFGYWRKDAYKLRLDPCEVAGARISINSLGIS